MGKRGGVVLIGLAIAVLLTFTSVSESDHVPLPQNASVEPPASSIPADIAIFSGRWEGQWGGGVPHILIIRKISADPRGRYTVDAVYAWGDASGGGGDIRKGWQEVEGVISKGQLEIQIPPRITVWYKIVNGGSALEGRWQGRTASFHGTFMKAPQ